MNNTQTWMWGTEDKPAILPKTKGSGIMVSDFIDEHNVFFLCLSPEELQRARADDPNFPEQARDIIRSPLH